MLQILLIASPHMSSRKSFLRSFVEALSAIKFENATPKSMVKMVGAPSCAGSRMMSCRNNTPSDVKLLQLLTRRNTTLSNDSPRADSIGSAT